ncbi:alpha/beta fold hydrolase [Bradyrhizobium sp. HKCCYLS1011]|uniref:alpha/beta fold hydrolase n=1 Tax=Bradyrhizobium sp. HKCCYLS1011 TaxID=3420733 RepID=UPI003EB9A87A
MTARTIRTEGAELIVDDTGRDDPALVFLHYWGGSARTWKPVLALLPQRIRKVAINQRGWGGSRAIDGRYDLDALASDVAAVVAYLGIKRYVVVGHSMGGKVAQVLAGRGHSGLSGLVLVAPAPPTAMDVPLEVRAGMLASYQSREGVAQALTVLAGPTFDTVHREQVIEDTLRGAPEAKRYWPQQGMIVDVSAVLRSLALPVDILLGEHDQVERESVLRPLFFSLLPHATFTVVPDAGHLIPIERPQVIASRCERMISVVSQAAQPPCSTGAVYLDASNLRD